MRYAVDMAKDDPGLLRDRLGQIAEEGGRVISIIWQPARVSIELGALPAGYVIVSEHS